MKNKTIYDHINKYLLMTLALLVVAHVGYSMAPLSKASLFKSRDLASQTHPLKK